MKFPQIAPSILSVDFFNPEKNISPIVDDVKVIHFDVMDYKFVPNLTFGPGFVKAFRTRLPDVFFDVHLMVDDADLMIDDFIKAGSNCISVHYEACRHLHRTLSHISSSGVKAGIAINPTTGIKHIENAIAYCDHILVMSVNPGFGGQKFIPESIIKLQEIDYFRKSKGLDFTIGIDGGVNLENINECAKSGADIIVTGNSLFKGDIKKNWNELKCKLN